MTPDDLGLALAVLVVALLYSAIRQAGASGYIAVMSLAGLSPDVIRPTALLLNVLVASLASLQFWRAGHFSWRLFWPFALLAVPMALARQCRSSLTSKHLQAPIGARQMIPVEDPGAKALHQRRLGAAHGPDDQLHFPSRSTDQFLGDGRLDPVQLVVDALGADAQLLRLLLVRRMDRGLNPHYHLAHQLPQPFLRYVLRQRVHRHNAVRMQVLHLDRFPIGVVHHEPPKILLLLARNRNRVVQFHAVRHPRLVEPPGCAGHKDKTALAVAAAAAPAVASAQTKPAFNAVIIGLGGRGGGAGKNFLDAAKTAEVEAKIVGVADIFPDKALGGKENFGLPDDKCFSGFDAYKKVLELPDVNYAILATPPGFRPFHFKACVEAGKNVFMEKPVAVDGPGCKVMYEAADLAKSKGLKVAAGTQRRHQAPYIETIKRIQDGAIGDIVTLRAYWVNGGPIWHRGEKGETDLERQIHNWYHYIWLCGDHICEQHDHNLDVCNWI